MQPSYTATFYYGSSELSHYSENSLNSLIVAVLTILEDSNVGTHVLIVSNQDGKVVQRCRKTIIL